MVQILQLSRAEPHDYIEFVPEFFDFFDPTPEQQHVVLIDIGTVREADACVTRPPSPIIW